MADDIIDRIRSHIQEVLRIVLDNYDRTLRELNEIVDQTNKGGQPLSPIHIEFERVRRSGRTSTKRTYENMQCAKNTSSRQTKKHKGTVEEVSTDSSPTKVFGSDESVNKSAGKEPASDERR
ncbi:uncharacterized protein RAG0_09738 [Rhynchosporium agropyri]|uniref:Uncharacterized protein n=1 Tax=Rhynchosporium agropyri TaxID=914238 RepID=A0A1E1KWV9_9HELO|nr:uncharacterized protein RAG0_09738 [Rhynchosporium agropyri]